MWFTENPWPPIVLALVAGLVFLGLWNANRRGLHFVLSVACLLAAAAFYFLERAIVTEGERLQQHVVQLCHDFRDKSENFPDYVSDNHPELKELFSEAVSLVTIQRDLRLSDFQTTITGENSGRVRFRANATINIRGVGDVGYQPAHIELVFQRENGRWKIIEVRRFNPINGREMEPLQRSAG